MVVLPTYFVVGCLKCHILEWWHWHVWFTPFYYRFKFWRKEFFFKNLEEYPYDDVILWRHHCFLALAWTCDIWSVWLLWQDCSPIMQKSQWKHFSIHGIYFLQKVLSHRKIFWVFKVSDVIWWRHRVPVWPNFAIFSTL